MRLVEIGIEGISLKVDSDIFWVASEIPIKVLSSSIIGGDSQETRHILSARVPADPAARDFALKRPRAYLREKAQALGIQETVVGLITAMDHERLQVANYAEGGIKVAALATVGLKYLSAPGRHRVAYTGDSQVGTINQVVLVDAQLSPWAMLRAATLATEAKALALFEAGIKTEGGSIATGTSMDTIVIAATGKGIFSRYAGTSTLVGHLIGQAVYDTVAAGVSLEQSTPVNL